MKVKPIYCSKCGKNMSTKGATFSMLRIELKGRNKWVRIQLGKYYKNTGKHRFDFCAECWLDSLFGKK